MEDRTMYKCLDCGNEMKYEGGLLWNATLTECFYGFKCPNCGSSFYHRLTKEEEEELTQRAAKEKENEKEILSPLSFFTPKITTLVMLAGIFFFSILCILSEYTQGRGEAWILPIVICTFGLVFMLINNRKRGANKK